jgi:carboxylesterase
LPVSPWLILAASAIAATAAVRYVIARRVEREDAGRSRDAGGVLVGAAGFTLDRPGAPGVLLLHGGGDTPQTLRELGEYLHQRGFAVAAPLLPGHGRSVRDFRHVSFDEYRRTAEQAYDRLAGGRPWMGVAGLSMGGALAAVTVADRPATRALVLLAPYVELPAPLRFATALSRLAELFSPYFSAQDPRSVRDPVAAAQGLAYGVFTPGALRALRRTASAGFAALSRIRTPTLIVQSRQDNRVEPGVATRALAALGADDKRLEWVSEGGHVITVDYGKAAVFALAGDWLASHGAESLLQS